MLDTYDLVYEQAMKGTSHVGRQELAAIQDTVSVGTAGWQGGQPLFGLQFREQAQGGQCEVWPGTKGFQDIGQSCPSGLAAQSPHPLSARDRAAYQILEAQCKMGGQGPLFRNTGGFQEH